MTVGRYRRAVHEDVTYEKTSKILGKLEKLENSILDGLTALKESMQ